MDRFKYWLAGKFLKMASRLMDDATRREVFCLMARAAESGMLDRTLKRP